VPSDAALQQGVVLACKDVHRAPGAWVSLRVHVRVCAAFVRVGIAAATPFGAESGEQEADRFALAGSESEVHGDRGAGLARGGFGEGLRNLCPCRAVGAELTSHACAVLAERAEDVAALGGAHGDTAHRVIEPLTREFAGARLGLG